MSAIELLDLENVEIVIAVERAFGIEISDAEAVGCHTVADLFAVVAGKVPNVERGALPCPTASAFRRLRAILRGNGSNLRVTPATRLAELMPLRRRRAWWRQLERSTGLTMPAFPAQAALPSARTLSLTTTALACVVGGAALIGGAGWWSAALGTLALVAFETARRSYSPDVLGLGRDATIGDLAGATASLNAGLLARPAGRMRRREVWTALEGVIRNLTGYSGPIDKRTSFKCI